MKSFLRIVVGFFTGAFSYYCGSFKQDEANWCACELF